MANAKTFSSFGAFVVLVLALVAYQFNLTLPINIGESFTTLWPRKIVPGGCLSLIEYRLPRVLSTHHTDLCTNGWFPVELDSKSTSTNDKLYDSLVAFLDSGRQFFNMPDSYKEQFLTEFGPSEGWSRVEGEKEMVTLHTLDKTPDELRRAAAQVWSNAGTLLNGYLEKMSLSLGFPAETLASLSKPNINMDNVRRSTELRLFRYEGNQPKIVSRVHKDLGMLSLVFGDVPGLEVWHMKNQTLLPIEKMYESPTATITMGRELEFLSNGLYPAGAHLVRAYGRESSVYNDDRTSPDKQSSPSSPATSPKYRHSLVFVMRAHWPVTIDLDQMTTNVTGSYKSLTVADSDGKAVELRKFTAGDLFAKLRGANVNVNSQALDREKQRQSILEREAKARAQATPLKEQASQ